MSIGLQWCVTKAVLTRSFNYYLMWHFSIISLTTNILRMITWKPSLVVKPFMRRDDLSRSCEQTLSSVLDPSQAARLSQQVSWYSASIYDQDFHYHWNSPWQHLEVRRSSRMVSHLLHNLMVSGSILDDGERAIFEINAKRNMRKSVPCVTNRGKIEILLELDDTKGFFSYLFYWTQLGASLYAFSLHALLSRISFSRVCDNRI